MTSNRLLAGKFVYFLSTNNYGELQMVEFIYGIKINWWSLLDLRAYFSPISNNLNLMRLDSKKANEINGITLSHTGLWKYIVAHPGRHGFTKNLSTNTST